MAEDRASEWYTCVRAARPFRELSEIPEPLKIPRWFVLLLAMLIAVGAVLGLSGDGSFAVRVADAAFRASLYSYVAVSLLDLWEHYRLEHHVTGRWLSFVVIPFGESFVHGLIVSTLVTVVVLARPVQASLEWRDWLVLVGPIVFLALGWIDELKYHRRRALHREDMLHTVSHLAAGAMLVGLFASRVVTLP